jgi:hypothetical protein
MTTVHRALAICVRRQGEPKSRLTQNGDEVKAGSPTAMQVQLDGESRWRRVYRWSDGTLFVRLKGVPHIVRVN